MGASTRFVSLGACASLLLACSFDDNGLATGSNSAGTLESGGSETTGGDSNTTTQGMTTTSSATTVGMTSDESGPQTTMPSTTAPSTESGTTEPGTSDGTDSSEGSQSETLGTSTGPAESSEGSSSDGGSETGGVSNYYADCTIDADCGANGVCVDFGSGNHVCYIDCAPVDADPPLDCPVPDTGSAIVICTETGCALDCDNDPCPTGMTCIGFNTGMSFEERCVWD